ncbi:hypothetical protein F5882DRAFT_446348 [Hyaloscypha sp. PMI_1271]|nr:hypothetical protein F5882DRAFT_446348 [Hyaloscypha sp. PMI_1271]
MIPGTPVLLGVAVILGDRFTGVGWIPGSHFCIQRRRKQLDHTYQRPRSSRPQPDISGPGDSDSAIEGRSLVDDDSVTCQSDLDDMTINQSSDSLMTDMPQPLQKCEAVIPEIVVKEVPYEGVQGQSTAHDHTIGNDSVKGNTVHRQPPVTVDESTEDNQTTRRPPSPCEAEQQETALPEMDVKVSDAQAPSATSSPHGTEPLETTLSGPTPSTPVRQTGKRF